LPEQKRTIEINKKNKSREMPLSGPKERNGRTITMEEYRDRGKKALNDITQKEFSSLLLRSFEWTLSSINCNTI
jgi:hypothetical protein